MEMEAEAVWPAVVQVGARPNMTCMLLSTMTTTDRVCIGFIIIPQVHKSVQSVSLCPNVPLLEPARSCVLLETAMEYLVSI